MLQVPKRGDFSIYPLFSKQTDRKWWCPFHGVIAIICLLSLSLPPYLSIYYLLHAFTRQVCSLFILQLHNPPTMSLLSCYRITSYGLTSLPTTLLRIQKTTFFEEKKRKKLRRGLINFVRTRKKRILQYRKQYRTEKHVCMDNKV